MTTTKALAKLYEVITGEKGRNSAAKIISDLADNWSDSDTKYTAGANVAISDDNVISATDTTYSAGENVAISDGVISATDTTYSAATASVLGLVKQGVAVADAAGEAPTAAEFKALLDSLRDAGVIADS